MQWLAIILVATMLFMSACGQPGSSTIDSHNAHKPVSIEHIEGVELSRVILSERAIQRLGIKTVPVAEKRQSDNPDNKGHKSIIPYSSVLYDSNGDTWAYITREPRVFTRHQVEIQNIDGDQAFLSDGPTVGTSVVMVGAAELFGAEFEIGH